MVTINVTDAAVQVQIGLDELAVLAADKGTEDPAIVKADGLKLGGLVEVGHLDRGFGKDLDKGSRGC